jgi:cytochrome c-type biogenesis protein CcmE
VAAKRSPARLVIALSVAALLAVFLLYTSIAGGTPSLQPSELAGHSGVVILGGKVVGKARGNSEDGYRFLLRDVNGTRTVRVLYRDSLPDLFRPGREIGLEGRLRNGVFVGKPGSLITKCPSKYTPASNGS